MLCFDIETVPAVDTDTDQMRRLALRREQEPATFAALFPPLAKVVAVGMRDDPSGRGIVCVLGTIEQTADVLFDYSVEAFASERDLLIRVSSIMAKVGGLLTFNGRGYDIPVLIHRMLINGVDVPAVLWRAINQKPWESGHHIDLANALNFGGAFGRYPLEAYCLAYGVKNPKAGGDGAGVATMVEEGRIQELAAYCMGDVDATLSLWRAWMVGQ